MQIILHSQIEDTANQSKLATRRSTTVAVKSFLNKLLNTFDILPKRYLGHITRPKTKTDKNIVKKELVVVPGGLLQKSAI